MLNTHLAPIHLGPGVNDGRHANVLPAPSAQIEGGQTRIGPTRAVPEHKRISVNAAVRLTVNIQCYTVKCIGRRACCVSEAPISLTRLFGGRPDVIGGLVLGAEIRWGAHFGPSYIGVIESVNPQALGRIIPKFPNLLCQAHDLTGIGQDFEQTLFAILRNYKVQPLSFPEFMELFLWELKVLGRALDFLLFLH